MAFEAQLAALATILKDLLALAMLLLVKEKNKAKNKAAVSVWAAAVIQ